MKQCETCIWNDAKDDLIACEVSELAHAWNELKKQIPGLGKGVKDHECSFYEESCP